MPISTRRKQNNKNNKQNITCLDCNNIIAIDGNNMEIVNNVCKNCSNKNNNYRECIDCNKKINNSDLFFSIYNDTMCFCEYCGNNELGYKAKNYIDFFKTPKELFIK